MFGSFIHINGNVGQVAMRQFRQEVLPGLQKTGRHVLNLVNGGVTDTVEFTLKAGKAPNKLASTLRSYYETTLFAIKQTWDRAKKWVQSWFNHSPKPAASPKPTPATPAVAADLNAASRPRPTHELPSTDPGSPGIYVIDHPPTPHPPTSPNPLDDFFGGHHGPNPPHEMPGGWHDHGHGGWGDHGHGLDGGDFGGHHGDF
jgi:hypothetical protein